jgi:hypothetical protein
MDQVLERCAALDVHKAQVTAWVRVPDGHARREDLRARYSTMAGDLLALRDWLKELGVTHVLSAAEFGHGSAVVGGHGGVGHERRSNSGGSGRPACWH